MNLTELRKEIEKLISLKSDNPHSVVNLRLESIHQAVEAMDDYLEHMIYKIPFGLLLSHGYSYPKDEFEEEWQKILKLLNLTENGN